MRDLLISIFIIGNLTCAATDRVEWGTWTAWGDQGDGTYLNPILPSDHSDIDCIKVGDDYYAISSTFQFSPGMTIMHSRDLVNWEICGHAVSDLTQIGPELNWDKMNRYGQGIWAGTLRYHEGRFYVFFGTPSEGFFMTSASSPAGPWDPLTVLLDEPGWDDCSALWDDKGNCYFIGTHFGDGYKNYLFKMSKDARRIDRESAKLVYEGNMREANKLIKAGDWYYLVFSEHKPDMGRYVLARRSKKISGPYNEERILALPSRDAMEPNQGGIVQGAGDNWYFMTHHGSGDWAGRIVSLLPVTWIDGWPIIGEVTEDENGNAIGKMQWSAPMPYHSCNRYSFHVSDEFESDTLHFNWQWNHQPRAEMYSLSDRPGWMRLKAFRPVETNNLMKAGNTLTQRCFRVTDNDVTIKMNLDGMKPGQKAGLCHFSSGHAAVGITMDDNSDIFLEYRDGNGIIRDKKITSPDIWFKSKWGLNGQAEFYYSLNGDEFFKIGTPYQMHYGAFRGDRIGIYCFNDNEDDGWVDVDYFRYSIVR